jgi:hypothetical protein
VKEGIDQGTNGFTTVSADGLFPNNTYYWHVRAQGGGTTGVFSQAVQFRVGAQVTLSAVTMVAPRDFEFATAQPVLTVSNVIKSGPAGPITYKFEVADTSSFGNIVASGTMPEGSVQTSYTVSPPLATGRTYFWRVTAMDAANGVSSVSPVRNFSVITSIATLLASEEGLTLWTGAQPPGQPGALGHDIFGTNWDVGEKISNGGVHYTSPQLEGLRLMDLMDRGMTPPDAIAWMKSNGYPTVAAYYGPPLEVIGILYQYLAGIDPATGKTSAKGVWNLVDRVEGE